MRHTLFLLVAALAISTLSAYAEKVSGTFNSTTLPEALIEINSRLDSTRISFVYDRIEDYIVTTRIDNLDPYPAIRRLVGFYPISVRQSPDGKFISVEPLTSGRAKLMGRLVTSDGHPIEYANIRLFNISDSSFITGGVSNPGGYFVIPTDEQQVIMEASRLGYLPLKTTTRVGDLGELKMVPDVITLNMVTVRADGVQFHEGRYVAIPSKQEVRHSYDTFSLIGMLPLPGLFVNSIQKKIEVNGGSVLILVDGIIRDMAYLQQIRPARVARVEYYTEVPPRYAGGDIAAVINLIMTAPKDGGTFYASPATAVSTGNADIPIGFSYNQGKSEFSFRYTFSWRDYKNRYSDSEMSYIAPDFNVRLKEHGYLNPMHYGQHSTAANYTLRIDSTSVFSTSFSLSGYNSHNYGNYDMSSSIDGAFGRSTGIRNESCTPTAEVYFQKSWKNGSTLEAMGAASLNTSSYDRLLTDTLSAADIRTYPSSVHSRATSFSLNANYDIPLGRYFTLTIKTNGVISTTANDYITDDFKADNRHNELWSALSVSYRRGRFNGTFSSGITGTWLKNDFQKWNKTFPSEYLVVGYSFNNHLNSNIEFRTAETIQSLSNMTPFEQEYDGYLTVTGNPHLKDGRFWSVRPRLNYGTGNFQVSLQLLYNNYWRWAYTCIAYKGDGHFVQYPVNTSDSYLIRPQVYLGWRKLFDGHLNLNAVFIYDREATTISGVRYTNSSWSGKLSAYLFVGRATIELMLQKMPWRLSGSTKKIGENNSYLSAVVNVGKGWEVQGALCFILDKKGSHYRWVNMDPANPGEGESWIKDNFMMFRIGFRYDMSFGRIFRRHKRSIYGGHASPDVKVVQ